jgi:hypothetical protein
VGGNGWYANQEDPRYAATNAYQEPTGTDQLAPPSPARTGRIWGSLFQSFTNYTLFTGGLAQFAEDGQTPHPISPFGLPYQQGWTRPAVAGPQDFRPKLSAFVNRALGAANGGRTPMTRSPMPLPVERSFAVPMLAFGLPGGQTSPLFNRQPGYVTAWPVAQPSYKVMGGTNG